VSEQKEKPGIDSVKKDIRKKRIKLLLSRKGVANVVATENVSQSLVTGRKSVLSVERRKKLLKLTTTEVKKDGSPAGRQSKAGLALKKRDIDLSGLIERGKDRGYVTLRELGHLLMGEEVSDELLEDIVAVFSEHDIDVLDEGTRINPQDQSDDFSGAPHEGTIDPSTLGKSTDPVRMYLREMGNVSLESRLVS
jgi:hypothetical protein